MYIVVAIAHIDETKRKHALEIGSPSSAGWIDPFLQYQIECVSVCVCAFECVEREGRDDWNSRYRLEIITPIVKSTGNTREFYNWRSFFFNVFFLPLYSTRLTSKSVQVEEGNQQQNKCNDDYLEHLGFWMFGSELSREQKRDVCRWHYGACWRATTHAQIIDDNLDMGLCWPQLGEKIVEQTISRSSVWNIANSLWLCWDPCVDTMQRTSWPIRHRGAVYVNERCFHCSPSTHRTVWMEFVCVVSDSFIMSAFLNELCDIMNIVFLFSTLTEWRSDSPVDAANASPPIDHLLLPILDVSKKDRYGQCTRLGSLSFYLTIQYTKRGTVLLYTTRLISMSQ